MLRLSPRAVKVTAVICLLIFVLPLCTGIIRIRVTTETDFSRFLIQDDGSISWAIEIGLPDEAVMQRAAERPQWLNTAPPQKWPPLHAAVVHSRLELIRPLIAAGAEVNGIVESTAMTPLHTAAMCGNEQAVKLLLELGADPALRTTRGQSAAELAAGPHRDDITSLLKKYTRN